MRECMRKLLVFFLSALLLVACGQRKGSKAEVLTARSFPRVEVPAMIQDNAGRQQYVSSHFWDSFLAMDGVSDSLLINGVKKEEVEQNLSTYVALMHLLPVDEAQKHISDFFRKLDETQSRQGKTLLYLQMTELVAKYLYDPNSPYRSEDLYLPFVEGMVASGNTQPDKLTAYRFELEKCRINPYGSMAPDFKFKDIKGRTGSLHGVKGEYTMLFFSNPGCETCLEIIETIQAKPYIGGLIAGGKLAIVNIYIDYEVDTWKSYAPKYPSDWINAYDFEHRIYDEEIYFVRAIPSLYLLDKDKRIIFKDVPVERALAYLEETLKTQ